MNSNDIALAAASPRSQRDQLLEAERQANQQQPRNFKEDALTKKIVRVEPDGIGPTPPDSFDANADRKSGPDMSGH